MEPGVEELLPVIGLTDTNNISETAGWDFKRLSSLWVSRILGNVGSGRRRFEPRLWCRAAGLWLPQGSGLEQVLC